MVHGACSIIESVIHGECDARPAVSLPAAQNHRPLTSTKLYCLLQRQMCVNNLPLVATPVSNDLTITH